MNIVEMSRHLCAKVLERGIYISQKEMITIYDEITKMPVECWDTENDNFVFPKFGEITRVTSKPRLCFDPRDINNPIGHKKTSVARVTFRMYPTVKDNINKKYTGK